MSDQTARRGRPLGSDHDTGWLDMALRRLGTEILDEPVPDKLLRALRADTDPEEARSRDRPEQEARAPTENALTKR